jgi:superfamily II DNA or RNA helicase
MSQTIPRPFQNNAIDSGVALFSECKRLLDAAPGPENRWAAVSQHGKLLIEAPTGAGKTLIAGHILEIFSAAENVVWFWFAPFKGLVGQTASTLRAELPGLRLRELSEDRQAVGSRSGDVFVTTWQTVATSAKDSRNAHIPGERSLTVEEMLHDLREGGNRIGVVVDEAHHGFLGNSGETQAMRFFRETLDPDYTLLITATPNDAAIDRFTVTLKGERINRLTISRNEPVAEGLIKEGIKCAAYFAPPGREALVDYEDIALRQGIAVHRALKEELRKIRIDLIPLLLVQVDSKTKSVERTRDKLIHLGFTEQQIATHTSDEPDAHLLALANDFSKEVLVFKMAVALGFDAPRASTLVSMRAARDEDFGVQLVGRILRVHRLLQSRARGRKLPELLRYGYVFLADATAQEGLDRAGQRINRLRTEYAHVSPTTVIVQVGDSVMVQVTGPNGQTSLLPIGPPAWPKDRETSSAGHESSDVPENLVLELMTGAFDELEVGLEEMSHATSVVLARKSAQGQYSYRLRDDVPHVFRTQRVSAENEVTEEDCARKFMISSAQLLQALVANIKVDKLTVEVFSQQIEMDFANAAMDPDETARVAYKVLTKNQDFDARELRMALLQKLKITMMELAMDQASDPSEVARMLNVLLCARPEVLYSAQKAALAAHCEVQETEEPLPSSIETDTPLGTSRLNVYGVFPSDLNSWERPFAEYLDRDSQHVVLWWHRNPVNKPWSVQVVLGDGRAFYPDFIIGITGRPTEDHALLADPKFAFETGQELLKSHAHHPDYGNVLILSLQEGRWMTVRYDAQQNRAVLDRDFLLADAAGY